MTASGWPLSVQVGGSATGLVPAVTVMTRATGDVRFQPFEPSGVWTTETDGPLAVTHQV